MASTFIEEISLLVRSRYPLVYLVSAEEERVLRSVAGLAGELKKDLWSWTSTSGMVSEVLSKEKKGSDRAPLRYGEVGEGAASPRDPLGALDHILASSSRGIFLLHDFHVHLDEPQVVRRMRDLVAGLRSTFKTVLILAPKLVVPTELEKDLSVVDVPLPDREELSQLLNRFLAQIERDRRFEVNLTASDRERVVHTVCGLTESQAWRVFSKVTVDDRVFDLSDLGRILEEKRQEIRKLGILEYTEVAESSKDVGGLGALKEWVDHRKQAFGKAARDYGLPEPKGVLLLGVQGCGKSLSSKVIAATLGLPLLRLDVGRIFSSYIGQSEENMRKAISMAEGLSPVVLWIDEIEKGFAGTDGGAVADSGATMRVFATFLTWLQEKTAPVFVVATANRIKSLPPELLRKGRFDEIFFIDLPQPDERREIFSIHIGRRNRDATTFDLERLASESDGYSGAEIEQAVLEAMFSAFARGREISTEDISKAINRTVPLSRTMYEEIAGLREWAVTRARPATLPPS